VVAKRIDEAVGSAAVEAAAGGAASREELALAVRWTLQALAEAAPGHTVEVRVPPFGAVQAIGGPRHTRGTPPNVIEMDAATWLALATGRLSFAEAVASGRVAASGARADLTAFLPIAAARMDP
jgi:hypothetical protein